MLQSKPRLGLAIGLFFLAPLLAEFLLGNLPITMLGALVVLAPLYGGCALLIRESVRRTGHGWPSIVILGLAYGIFEEAFTTQSLFNPNYLGLHLHLLDPAYIPALGIGAWWTVFVLTIHTAFSISASIALIEAFAPENPTAPWLGRTGLTITGLLFIFGAVASTLIGYIHDHFLASPAQLVSAAVICVILALIAFRTPQWNAAATAWVPNPWLAAAFALAAGSAILLIPSRLGWGAATAILAVDAIVLAAVLSWSRSLLWNMRHKLALAAGAALAYGWHSFFETPAVGQMNWVRAGNAIFLAAAVVLIAAAASRNRRSKWAPVAKFSD
ncbi:MAG TPA: hypothetical protein VF283_14030 [Bryobacteraceae bacterium]